MKLNHTSAALAFGILMLHSCNDTDEISGDKVSGDSPIMVSASRVSPFTRSYIPQGMYDNFKVYAVSEKGGSQTTVMDGYDVRFHTDTWTYVTEDQRLMYWDINADRYLFTAGAPIDAVTAISATSVTLHLENNTTGSAMASEPLSVERDSPDFGKTVNFRFAYTHSMVRVAFVRDAAADVTVSDISLTPDAPIASKADLTYHYDWSTTPVTTTTQLNTTESSGASLCYAEVTIPRHTTDAVLSETSYYCVPAAANHTGWSISLMCDGEHKAASFANSSTWESGKCYTYVFSLTEKTPKLVKVITQDSYFDCNDTVIGGEFSDADMTE